MRKLVFLLFLCQSALADYTNYYRLINKAEEEFILKKNTDCFRYYDSAFASYKKPFVKDAYVAAQIAYHLNKPTLFLKYLDQAFKNGMPLSAVPSAPILRKITALPIYKDIKQHYEQYKNAFKPDLKTREQVLKYCFDSDSIKLGMGLDSTKIRAFYAVENTFREYLHKNYLAKGLFPNEHLIGIATDTMYKNFMLRNKKKDPYEGMNPFGNIAPEDLDKMEYDLVSKFALSVLIHSRCSYWKFKDGLWQAVLAGYFHPKEYGMLHEMSITWNQNTFNTWDNCDIKRQRVYYNLLGYSPVQKEQTFVRPEEDLKIVEANRQERLMQKYSVDQLKKKAEQETGIRFFFGFMNII
jgi:hypothetical protein